MSKAQLKDSEIQEINELGDVEKVTRCGDHIHVYPRFTGGDVNNAYLVHKFETLADYKLGGVKFSDECFVLIPR